MPLSKRQMIERRDLIRKSSSLLLNHLPHFSSASSYTRGRQTLAREPRVARGTPESGSRSLSGYVLFVCLLLHKNVWKWLAEHCQKWQKWLAKKFYNWKWLSDEKVCRPLSYTYEESKILTWYIFHSQLPRPRWCRWRRSPRWGRRTRTDRRGSTKKSGWPEKVTFFLVNIIY